MGIVCMDGYSKLVDNFLCLYNQCFPKIKVKLKPHTQFNPWITKEVLQKSENYMETF